MRKLKPDSSSSNPLGAALVGAALMGEARQTGSSSQRKAGLDLLKAAEKAAQGLRPPKGAKLAKQIKLMRETMLAR